MAAANSTITSPFLLPSRSARGKRGGRCRGEARGERLAATRHVCVCVCACVCVRVSECDDEVKKMGGVCAHKREKKGK